MAESWWWISILAVPLGWAALVVMLRWPQMWWWQRSLIAFELRLPRDVTVEQVSRWAGMLRSVLRARRWWSLIPRWPIGVEITATRDGITRMLLVPRQLRGDVLATLAAAIPGARLDELVHDHTRQRSWFHLAAEAGSVGAGELLATDRGEDTNRHLIAALQPLEAGEVVRVQWLLAGAVSPRIFAHPGLSRRDIAVLYGARWAADQPALLATCRIGVVSHMGRARVRGMYGRVWAALRGMNTPQALLVRRLLPTIVVRHRLWRRTVPVRRWPLLLIPSEIAGLLGLATGSAIFPGLPTAVSRALPAASAAPSAGVVVAASNYPGQRTMLRLSASDRLRHLWIAGPTGVGKSTLLANMISYDIHHGDGLGVVDARGDLIADVLDRIPAARLDDVIVIDPTCCDHVVGLNPLQAGPPEQAAGFAFHVLHSLYSSSWGPRTADILRAALLTLTTTKAAGGQAFTLVEVPELLTNPTFRRLVTSQPLPAQLVGFWRWYDGLTEAQRLNTISPVLNKLRVFTLSTPLRLLLGQSRGIDFSDIFTRKQIVLVALKKGLLGVETAALVGSLVMSAVWQASLSRVAVPAAQRRPVWLYVDEFQDVVRLPIDLADMLAQARGLGLGLTLAHQHLGQLTSELKAAVWSMARSQVVFQLNHHDSKELAPSFAPLTAEDLQNLGAYEIALRPCISGVTAAVVTGTTFPQPAAAINGQALAAASRCRYGQPREVIEQQITARTTAQTTGRRSNRIPAGAP